MARIRRVAEGGSNHAELLRGIWNELKTLGKNLGGRIDETNSRLDETNARLDQTNARLDQTNARLDQTNARLEDVRTELIERDEALHRALVERDLRLSTVVTQLAAEVRTLVGLTRDWREERRLDRDEDRRSRDDLRARVARIEVHVGLAPAP